MDCENTITQLGIQRKFSEIVLKKRKRDNVETSFELILMILFH